MLAFGLVISQMLEDVQERLVYRAQVYISFVHNIALRSSLIIHKEKTAEISTISEIDNDIMNFVDITRGVGFD